MRRSISKRGRMEARQVTNHGDLLRISQAVAASREGGGGAGGLLKSTTCTAVNKIYLVEAPLPKHHFLQG